jgi:gamma-glutamylcysteine synthetase
VNLNQPCDCAFCQWVDEQKKAAAAARRERVRKAIGRELERFGFIVDGGSDLYLDRLADAALAALDNEPPA